MNTDNPEVREKRYVLLGLIGTGTMGEIYRGRMLGAEGFEKQVALKKLLPQWTKDPAAVADFIDEARLGALCNHENVVQIYDFGESDGSYFLVMEHLAGKDLGAIMERIGASGGMPTGYALHIAAKICAGMAYVHALKDPRQGPLNLIHRELSPDNIVVTFEGKVKIVDFGCARTDIFDDRTRMGMMKGQVGYMSPEQLTATAVDQRADIFAIGILLYEMLSGRRMYGGDLATQIMKCRKAEYAELGSVASKLPSSVCAIVDKALQPDKNQRYQSCGQMLADIETSLAAIQPRPRSQLLGRYIRQLFSGELPEEKKRPVRIAPAVLPENEDALGRIPVAAAVADQPAGTSPVRFRRFRPAAGFFAGSIIILVVFIMSSDIADENNVTTAPKQTSQAVLELGPQAIPDPPPRTEQALAVVAEVPAKSVKSVIEQPVKRVIAPDNGRVKKIEELLGQATEAWEDKRLTDPEKDCAFWWYSKILALDPKNADAWQGIQRINNYYGDAAEQALSEYKFQKAEQLVQRGLQVFPDNRRLNALSKDMENRKQQYLEELSGKAELALRRDDLTTPVEDCAYTYYKRILKLDKRNDTALDGIDKIADRYAELADDAYRNLQLANCREFVKSGLAVTPHHPKLLELQEDLSRSMPGIFFKSVEKSLSTMFE